MSDMFKTKPSKKETCETHGEYESKNYMGKIWSKCPECAKIAAAEQADQEKVDEAAEKIRRWEAKLRHSSIPERFKDRTLESYIAETGIQQVALTFCIDFVQNFENVKKTGRSAIFCGKPGTGKTHLAIGVAIGVMEHHSATTLFVTVMKAIRRIKATWSRDAKETESTVMGIYSSPDLLILDEVGLQFGSETEENLLFDIINDRYEARKPTIIISNLGVGGVKKYLGVRSFDRLSEDGGKLVPFTWNSYRGRK